MNNKIFEIAKWGLIVFLGVLIMYLLKTNRELKSSYESYRKDGVYMRTYDSQTINQLKKTNKELYDSIKNKKDVKQGIIIRYKYVYNGDTIFLPRKLNNVDDSIYQVKNGKLQNLKDSNYAFNGSNDSINYHLTVNSKTQPNWYKLNFIINDKLTIINREVNGKNEMSIQANNGKIDGSEVFNKRSDDDNFFKRFSLGLQAGVGYGLLTNKPDLFIGIGIGFRLNKMK